MTAAIAKLAAALLVVALVWLIVGQVVRTADALMPCTDQAGVCATPGNTPNR